MPKSIMHDPEYSNEMPGFFDTVKIDVSPSDGSMTYED